MSGQPTLLDVARSRSLSLVDPDDHPHRRRSAPPAPGRCLDCGRECWTAYCSSCVPNLSGPSVLTRLRPVADNRQEEGDDLTLDVARRYVEIF